MPETAENRATVARELPAWPNLLPVQVQALDLLASGLPVGRVATRLNVHRGTIHRWKTQHPAFIAAMNRRQQDLPDTLSARRTKVLADAIKELAKDIHQRKSVKARRRSALAIVSAFGSRKFIHPAGPVTPISAVRHLAMQRRLQERRPLNVPLTREELTTTQEELAHDFYNEYEGDVARNDEAQQETRMLP